MSETLSIDFGEPIPVFPIPNCVLLPHASIPLHIFEHRYRQMVRDVLEGSRVIALGSFARDDWQDDYEGNPPLRNCVCVGMIVREDELPDGRFNILLQGICRAAILEEVPSITPYRLFMLEPSDAAPNMEIDMTDQRNRIEELLSDTTLGQLASVSAIQNWVSGEIPTAVLVDLAIMTLCDDSEERYRLLAENDIFKRISWLEHNLVDTRRTLRAAERIGPSISEDGFNLN